MYVSRGGVRFRGSIRPGINSRAQSPLLRVGGTARRAHLMVCPRSIVAPFNSSGSRSMFIPSSRLTTRPLDRSPHPRCEGTNSGLAKTSRYTRPAHRSLKLHRAEKYERRRSIDPTAVGTVGPSRLPGPGRECIAPQPRRPVRRIPVSVPSDSVTGDLWLLKVSCTQDEEVRVRQSGW